MGPERIAKPQAETARGAGAGETESAGWRGQLQRSLQTQGFEAARSRLSPQAMPVPQLRADVEAMAAKPDLASTTAEVMPAPAPAPAQVKAPVSHRPESGKTAKKVYDNNKTRATASHLKRKGYEGELDGFEALWMEHQGRYEAVAAKTGVPAKLIASLHWRESNGNFKTYLHQGDPLGKKAVHVPKNIPIFDKWEEAAIHALNMKKNVRDMVKMDENTTDPAALATYAEYYNGLGYHKRGKPSAYVWAGTDQYSAGKFVADGKYSSKTRDRQAGVMSLMATADAADAKQAADAKPK